MDLTQIITAAVVLAVIGLAVGLFIGFASVALEVKGDKKEEEILASLPGNNCGGCGFPGCAGLASAIAKGQASPGACPVGGKISADKISEIMGSKATETEHMVAFVKCAGNCENKEKSYEYVGPTGCSMLITLPGGGPKGCEFGCSAGGDCVRACPLNAIEIVDGVAKVSRSKCVGCGICVKTCPKNIIELIPSKQRTAVACASKAKGTVSKDKCDVSCVGCGLCARKCQSGAIGVENCLAVIDYDKCKGCGECIDACKRNVITELTDESK